MSGHSKWAQIKHRKAATDKKKGLLFSKLAREIMIAAKTGGDAETNYKLRLALDQAKDAGMTKEATSRAIKRGTGEDKAQQIEEVRYEGYGPGGVAFLVEASTDNRNRTTSEIRHIFTNHGGTLTPPGSTAYLFQGQAPQVMIEPDEQTKQLVTKLLEKLEDHEDVLSVRTNALL